MIYDSIERLDLYFPNGSLLHNALALAGRFDPAAPDGRCEISGDRLYAQVSTYETRPAAERRFEAHRKYIDVQVVLEGEERIDASLEPELKPWTEYDDARDLVFLEEPGDYASLVLRPGLFAVFFPHDVHRPGCSIREPARVRKLVFKVLVE